jgi:hypothetical protein
MPRRSARCSIGAPHLLQTRGGIFLSIISATNGLARFAMLSGCHLYGVRHDGDIWSVGKSRIACHGDTNRNLRRSILDVPRGYHGRLHEGFAEA